MNINILKCKKIKKGSLDVKKDGESLIITNNSLKKRGYLFFTKPSYSDGVNIKIEVDYEVLKGANPQIKCLDRKMRVVERIDYPSETYFDRFNRFYFVCISVEPNSTVQFNKLNITKEVKADKMNEFFKGNILLIAPGYPSEANKYNCAFVHTRVKEYKKLGWKIDVAEVCEPYIIKTVFHTFEGVDVASTGYNDIRVLLQIKHYDKILVHFFDEKVAQILDASDLSKTLVFLYSHGSDTMYWDWPKMGAKYFKPEQEITAKERKLFLEKDAAIKKYNNMPNVKWIFVTEWTQKNSEKLLGIKYKNACVIPCLVDEKEFAYKQRDPESRKKICFIRKFDDIASYSLDIDVRVILELSRRPFFDDLEFNIYGDGKMHDLLTAPVKKFKNVHIHKKFLSHSEMADMYRENGIALFATRYDSQAVASCEAAMSGCAVITSKGVGVSQFIDEKIGTYCETENVKEYADKIEEFYYDEKKFLDVSKKMHECVKKTCGYDQTIKKDIELIEKAKPVPIDDYQIKKVEDPILTIAIPSYNVAKYLKNGVHSLLNQKYANKLEILIINDGSKDNTAEVARELEKYGKVGGKQVVKLIDKENGGHGSTINKGIELARGKYFRLMDGDDYYISTELEKFIERLEHEDADIVLTNYIEDFSISGEKNVVRHYEFMKPYVQYNLNDMSYEGYGFLPWGPLLSTSTYKTEKLRAANFKIDEHCFYVDMEYNFIGYIACDTVTYYPLDIYNYYLGRVGQSVSKESYTRNCPHHEKVCIRLVSEFERLKDQIPEEKKRYLIRQIIIPMCKTQYEIAMEYFKNNKNFNSFDKKLKEYPEFYHMNEIAGKRVRLHRRTGGLLIRFDSIIKRFSK